MPITEPILDLMLVETNNVETLAIADISVYPPNFQIVGPTIEITPPGWSKKAHPFAAGAINVYRAFDLGIICDGGCVELPDGIYTVKYTIAPSTMYMVEKEFLRVEKIKKKYLQAYLKIDQTALNCSNQKNAAKERLDSINVLIQGSIAAAAVCDLESAYALYMKADEMLNSALKGCTTPVGGPCKSCTRKI